MSFKCGRTRPFLTGFQFRGDLTEGSLGGRLAQRHAALRELMAAGARFISCYPSWSSALLVPRPADCCFRICGLNWRWYRRFDQEGERRSLKAMVKERGSFANPHFAI